MTTAIKQHVTVGEGGLIELRAPELPAGTSAEIIVLIEPTKEPRRPLSSFFGAGKGSFKSVEEVDAYIRELRDEWED